MDFRPEIAPLSSIMNPELFLIWDDGLMTSLVTSMLASAHPNTAAKRNAHEHKIWHPVSFLFPVSYINQLRKHNIAVAPSLKAKRAKQTKKGAKKITSIESLYIFLVSNFCTTWLSVCTNGENDVWSLHVASARHDDFVFTGFLACFWFGIS